MCCQVCFCQNFGLDDHSIAVFCVGGWFFFLVQSTMDCSISYIPSLWAPENQPYHLPAQMI